MNRLGASLAALLTLSLAALPASGQVSKKPSSSPKKPPTFVVEADDEGEVVKGVEVAPLPMQPREVKRYPVNHQGTTAMGVTVFIPELVYYSDGRVRVHYSFWNRSKESQTFYFNFEDSFLADEQSNPYPQVARQIISGNRGSIYMVTITSDRRLNTWIDFKAPALETPRTKFKVGVMLEGRYDHRADAFKPFVIELTDPLPPYPKKPKTAKEERDEGLIVVRPDQAEGERSGEMVRRFAFPEEAELAVKPTLAASEAVLASAKEGRKYEGSIRGADGYATRGGIQFEHRSDGRLLAATIYRHAQPQRDIWLIGDFHPQRSAPGGLVVRFADFRKVEYSFTIDNNNMKGKDTDGNTFTFLLVKE